jgi:hypothetical protein
MADVPHLQWPFRLAGRKLAQVEQDSLEDLQQSVHAFLSTPLGSRPLNPDFGLEDPTFSAGVDPLQLEADIEASEDGRAAVTVTVAGPSGAGAQQIDIVVAVPES